jgi:hypothetical protein
MTTPGSRLIVLTGAPDGSSLQWDPALLSMQLLPAFSDSDISTETQAKAAEDHSPPAWRYVAMRCQHLPTGLSQRGLIRTEDYAELAPRNGETSFFGTSSLSAGSTTAITDDLVEFTSSTETDEEVLSQFYEHSFITHQNTTSSQIQSQDEDQSVADDPSAAITSTSFLTSTCASDSFGSPISLVQVPTPVPASRRIRDLGELPASSYLRAINPQTMTVNLVVGIISISAPRSITTRREGREMHLVEMLVGDETKAGFSINIWLPSLQHDKEHLQRTTHLEDVLGTLRRQDVVLFRNVALNAFMGKVYGQSLRKDLTKLELLHRNGRDESKGLPVSRGPVEGYGGYAQAAKMMRVKQWVVAFVGSTARPRSAVIAGARSRSRRANGEQEYTLPPDTQ